MTPTVQVILMDLSVNEAVTENADGSYTIFINARLNHESQLDAYNHAMKHIENNDFERNDVQLIEAVAHGTAKEPIPAERYREKLEQIRKKRKLLQRKMKQHEKKVKFLQTHYDLYKLAEHRYLYGE